MEDNDLSDEEIVFMLTPYAILADKGIKCVTKDGKDLTEDLKKVVKI